MSVTQIKFEIGPSLACLASIACSACRDDDCTKLYTGNSDLFDLQDLPKYAQQTIVMLPGIDICQQDIPKNDNNTNYRITWLSNETCDPENCQVICTFGVSELTECSVYPHERFDNEWLQGSQLTNVICEEPKVTPSPSSGYMAYPTILLPLLLMFA